MEVREYYSYKPDYVIHPGEYLEEVLEAREIKKNDLSERIGVSVKHISQIINKQALLTSELSLQLERTLGISANIWNGLSSGYSLYEARQKEQEQLKHNTEWVKKFPIKDLIRLGYLPKKNIKFLTENVLEFFGISNPEQWEQYYSNREANFRKSNSFKDNLHHVAAWLRSAELEASKIDVKPYQKDLFKTNLYHIRSITVKKPFEFESEMRKLCAEAGVVLTFVPEYEGTHISGAARWLTSEKALIIMSLRHKTNDHFWFTFFHEAAHILLHSKKDVFIDDPEGYESKEESEANRFARNIMIPEDAYKVFISKNNYYKNHIEAFAHEIDIHPGIVVGTLQYDKKISYSWHNKLKERFTLSKPKIEE